MQTNWGNIQACRQASYTQTTANLQNAITIISFNFAVNQNDEINYSIAFEKKDACCSSHINNLYCTEKTRDLEQL